MNEQEQWESVKRWLRENATFLLVGIVLGLGVVFGWRYWQEHQDQQALNASNEYGQIIDALGSGDNAKALTTLTALEKAYPQSPYVDQGRLVLARAHIDKREYGPASELLALVAESKTDPVMALVARVRLAKTQTADGKADAALTTLQAVEPGAFKAQFDEARGDALLAKGDRGGALAAYQAARSTGLAAAIDTEILDLKIADLATGAPDAPATPAADAG
ncbi:MAG: tetratricopeptide repeat protein [Steroidobacteraceae bacterium]